MEKGLQRIGGFRNASLHFNFQIEQRKKCGLQLNFVEVFVSIKRACFALFLFSTQI